MHQQRIASVFLCSHHFGDECLINKAHFNVGFAHRLILKDGAVPAIKGPGHDLELQAVSKVKKCQYYSIGRVQRG